ncbi:hypothetical protein LQZ19_08665 [Treponema primitia]|uniref:hypothetical protein n=1 Tax=Treponema primitia TaxID=88058 RepID=UPI00397E97D5
MDLQLIKELAIIAFTAIGIIELLKNYIKPKDPKKVWPIVAIPLTLALTAAYYLLPQFITIGLLSVSIVQIGYDIILQGFKKLITKVAE